MAKSKSVLDELAEFAPKRKNWFDLASKEMQAKLLEIKKLFQAGECTYSMSTIHAYARKNGVKVGPESLSKWLHAKD